MPIDFPNSPTAGDTHTVGSKTWIASHNTTQTRTNILLNSSFETNNTGWSGAQVGGAVRTSSSGYATTYSRTNRVVNPSFEVDLTNWTLTGSVTRITTDSYVGAACAQLAYAGSGTVLITSANITASAGAEYTLSFYLKQSVDTGSVICNFMFYNASNVLILDDTHQTNNPNTSWQRFSQTRTAPANTAYFRVRVYQADGEGGGAVATNTLVDAVMIEATSALRPYFDGSTADAWSGRTLTTALAWSGTANASTSTGTWSYSTSQNVSAYSGAWFGAATMSSTSDSNVFAVPTTSWSFASTATYVASAYVYVPVGSTLAGREVRIDFEGGTATGTTGTSSPAVLAAGTWVRASRPYTVTATGTKAIVFRLSGTLSTALDEPIYIDGVIVEQTDALRPYFDGSGADAYSGYTLIQGPTWTGTANASTSTATWGLDESMTWNVVLGDVMLAVGSVTAEKISDGAITEAKLASGSVTSAKIADGTIVNADVSASAAINATKITNWEDDQPVLSYQIFS